MLRSIPIFVLILAVGVNGCSRQGETKNSSAPPVMRALPTGGGEPDQDSKAPSTAQASPIDIIREATPEPYRPPPRDLTDVVLTAEDMQVIHDEKWSEEKVRAFFGKPGFGDKDFGGGTTFVVVLRRQAGLRGKALAHADNCLQQRAVCLLEARTPICRSIHICERETGQRAGAGRVLRAKRHHKGL